MYEVLKLVVVIGIILWALRDKIDEPRNVKYCCDKGNETEDDLSTNESSTNESSTNESSTNESSTNESSTVEVPSDDDAPTDYSLTEELSTIDEEPSTIDEIPAVEISTEELSTIDEEPSTIDEIPAIELSTEEISTEEISTEEISTEEISTEEISTEEIFTEEISTEELSTIDDAPEEDILSIEDLYGDYTDLLMPSIMLRLSNNTSINNTFVPRNSWFGVVHTSI